VKTEPISSLLSNENQQQHQQQQSFGGQQGQQQQQSSEPMHFAPGYAQQRQQEGKTGGVRPSDMPDEG